MIFALIYAVTALFVANPRVFPDALQTPFFQWSPVAVLFVVLIYWLIRIKFGNWRSRLDRGGNKAASH